MISSFRRMTFIMLGLVCLMAVSANLHAQTTQTDAKDQQGPFSMSLLEVSMAARSHYDDQGRMNRHAKLTLNTKWMLRNHSSLRMIRARQVELLEWRTDPVSANAQFSPQLKTEMDLYTWYATATDPLEGALLTQVELQSEVIAHFTPVREIESLRIAWEILYASGRPREVKLSPLTDHLNKWIGVEDIPTLRVKVTLEPIGPHQEQYAVHVNTPAMHHLWGVRFFDKQGQPVEPMGSRGHHPMQVVDPAESPVSSERFVVRKNQVGHIVLDVYPMLQTQRVIASAQNVPVLRPVSDQDKPTVILELK